MLLDGHGRSCTAQVSEAAQRSKQGAQGRQLRVAKVDGDRARYLVVVQGAAADGLILRRGLREKQCSIEEKRGNRTVTGACLRAGRTAWSAAAGCSRTSAGSRRGCRSRAFCGWGLYSQHLRRYKGRGTTGGPRGDGSGRADSQSCEVRQAADDICQSHGVIRLAQDSLGYRHGRQRREVDEGRRQRRREQRDST